MSKVLAKISGAKGSPLSQDQEFDGSFFQDFSFLSSYNCSLFFPRNKMVGMRIMLNKCFISELLILDPQDEFLHNRAGCLNEIQYLH